MKRILAATALAGVILYAGDYACLRRKREQLGSVAIKRIYAVKMRNRKTEYLPDEPAQEACVHSLFPQMGYAPCWYVTRHSVQRINIDAGRPAPLINTP